MLIHLLISLYHCLSLVFIVYFEVCPPASPLPLSFSISSLTFAVPLFLSRWGASLADVRCSSFFLSPSLFLSHIPSLFFSSLVSMTFALCFLPAALPPLFSFFLFSLAFCPFPLFISLLLLVDPCSLIALLLPFSPVSLPDSSSPLLSLRLSVYLFLFSSLSCRPSPSRSLSLPSCSIL